MIAHQAVGVHLKSGFLAGLGERFEEIVAVHDLFIIGLKLQQSIGKGIVEKKRKGKRTPLPLYPLVYSTSQPI
jgi:hypothetical protein